METISCGICRRRTPTQLAHEHHVRPQAAGGGPQDTTWLCGGCHDNVHRVYDMLKGPRAVHAEDVVRTFYAGDSGAQTRCMHFALEVLRWMQAKQDGRLQIDLNDEVEILVKIPLGVKNALQLLGREARDPETNRRLGLAGVARQALVQLAFRHQPGMKDAMRQAADRKKRGKS